MSTRQEIALAVGAAALFGGAMVAAFDWAPAAATFPLVICTAGLGLSLWAIARDVMAMRNAQEETETMSDEDRARARSSFVWIGVFFAAVTLIGFEWGVGLASLAFYRMEARLGWVAAVLSGAACGAFMYLAAHFLGIPLYDGIVVELLH